MKKIVLIIIVSLVVVAGLSYFASNAWMEYEAEESLPVDTHKTLCFFGTEVKLNRSILSQLQEIALKNKDITIKNNNIKVKDVEWGINVRPDFILLFSSIQPDDPKMKFVKEYITEIYGDPYDDESEGFDIKWSSSPDVNNIFSGDCTLVHLRRVHTEEGGTFLIFQ